MKKKIFKIVILLLLTSGINYVRGQSTTQEAQYKFGNIALDKFLNKKFGEEVKKRNIDICLVSATFVKFTVDTSGNIKGLAFSKIKGTPQVFRDILTSVILATNGSWIPRKENGRPVESKPFILPLIYEMEAGCNPRNVAADNMKSTYKPVPNGTATDLLYILDFEDNPENSVDQLDCVLLRPLRAFSQN